MSDRFGWLDAECEVIKKGGEPSGTRQSPEGSGVVTDIEKAYQDPEPGDENDPADQEEMCQIFKRMGWTPGQLRSDFWRHLYRKWVEAGN